MARFGEFRIAIEYRTPRTTVSPLASEYFLRPCTFGEDGFAIPQAISDKIVLSCRI
jgi:hypothetical protein